MSTGDETCLLALGIGNTEEAQGLGGWHEPKSHPDTFSLYLKEKERKEEGRERTGERLTLRYVRTLI